MKTIIGQHTKAIVLFILVGVITVFLSLKAIELYSVTQTSSTKPKNLILISIDTLRADSMGVYGYKKDTTPNIDAFAKRSTVFTNAYTQVPATYPSFAALMTGLSPFESGIYHNVKALDYDTTMLKKNSGPLSPKDRKSLDTKNLSAMPIDRSKNTLAKILHKNGYATGAFILNSVLSAELTGLNMGFDKYRIMSDIKYQRPDEVMMEEGLSWLDEKADGQKPFFIWMHFLDPHSPYAPPEEYLCKLNKKYCGRITEANLLKLEEDRIALGPCTQKALPTETVELYRALYDGEIAHNDMLIGRILDKVRKMGLDKNSIIIIFSDHGESFEKGYYFRHGFELYQSSVKIPVLIYSPGTHDKGSEVQTYIKNSDFFGIILNLLNINDPSGKTTKFELNDLMSDQKASEERPIFYLNTSATKYAIQKGRFKYILSPQTDICSKASQKLFDIENDPEEKNNIIASQRDRADKLHQELIDYVKAHPVKLTEKVTVRESHE